MTDKILSHIGSLQAQGAAQTRWWQHSQVLQGQSIAGLSDNVNDQGLKLSNTTSLALMITTVLCYSATSGIAVADCGKPSRVDMGNVG